MKIEFTNEELKELNRIVKKVYYKNYPSKELLEEIKNFKSDIEFKDFKIDLPKISRKKTKK